MLSYHYEIGVFREPLNPNSVIPILETGFTEDGEFDYQTTIYVRSDDMSAIQFAHFIEMEPN